MTGAGAGKQEARPRDTYAGQHDPVRWLAGWLAGWSVASLAGEFEFVAVRCGRRRHKKCAGAGRWSRSLIGQTPGSRSAFPANACVMLLLGTVYSY